MREILIFLILFLSLVAGLGCAIYGLGGSFGWNLKQSWALALVALGLLAPGIYNLIIFANPKGKENIQDRCFAFMRGLGMSAMGVACILPAVSNVNKLHPLLWIAGSGLALTIAATFIESILEITKRK